MGKIEYDILSCDSRVDKTEEYLCKTVNEKYSQEHAQQILAALDMAREAHRDQLRCNGAPYIIHPMRVALMLLQFDTNTISKILIGALLHDTLEKTGIKFPEIDARFGSYVAKLVQFVTRKHNESQSDQEKTEAKYQNWLEVIAGSHDVRMIKVCEDMDNIINYKSIPKSDPGWKKIPRWLSETETMSLPLAQITNSEAHSVMHQEYDYYVKSGFTDLTLIG